MIFQIRFILIFYLGIITELPLTILIYFKIPIVPDGVIV